MQDLDKERTVRIFADHDEFYHRIDLERKTITKITAASLNFGEFPEVLMHDTLESYLAKRQLKLADFRRE